MNLIDIDSLHVNFGKNPFAKQKASRGKKKSAPVDPRLLYVRSRSRWSRDRDMLGIRPETMANWRGLERRTHELHVAWRDANSKFWDFTRKIRTAAGADSDEDLNVLVDTGDEGIMNIDESGYSTSSKYSIVERLVRDPESEGKFVLVSYENGGRELGRLNHRESRLHKAFNMYQDAFRQAVEERLSGPINDRMRRDLRYNFYDPAVYIIENENRKYVVTLCRKGFIEWHEGDLHFTGEAR